MNEQRWLDYVNKSQHADKLDFVLREISPLLPPHISGAEGATALLRSSELRLRLEPKRVDTRARDVRLHADIKVTPKFEPNKEEFLLDWALSDLALTCHDPGEYPGAVLLQPCYADLLELAKEQILVVPNPNVRRTISLPLKRLLLKTASEEGESKETKEAARYKLPFKLSDIAPTVITAGDVPWIRISANARLPE